MVHVYTHIDMVLLIFMKSGAFCIKTGTFHEKHIKSNENWKAHEKHTWKMKSTWKVKSTPEKWKAHEKHLKSGKHHFLWKAYTFHYEL